MHKQPGDTNQSRADLSAAAEEMLKGVEQEQNFLIRDAKKENKDSVNYR